MPTYEYGCESCGHQWEQTQRITEAPIELCPACAKATAHRLISAGTGFILKGGGWYSDLYSSPKQSAESAKKDDGGGADPAKKVETKTDSSGEKSEKSAGKPTPSPSTTSTPSSPSTS